MVFRGVKDVVPPFVHGFLVCSGREVFKRHPLNNRNENSHRQALKRTLVQYGFAKGVPRLRFHFEPAPYTHPTAIYFFELLLAGDI